MAFSSLDIDAQARMMRLTRKGELEVEYQAVDRKHIKTEKWYRVNRHLLENLEIAKKAKKALGLARLCPRSGGGSAFERFVGRVFSSGCELFR